jgi:hypothetical protein
MGIGNLLHPLFLFLVKVGLVTFAFQHEVFMVLGKVPRGTFKVTNGGILVPL